MSTPYYNPNIKYSVNYQSSHTSEADEIRCPANQLGLIYKKLLSNNPNLRVVIQYTTKEDLDSQLPFIKKLPNPYTISANSLSLVFSLLNSGEPAYTPMPVTDWETFSYLVERGVSDIYIDGPLLFQDLSLHRCKQRTLIRVSPTISCTGALPISRPTNSAYIRPEDLHSYQSIDIVDFNPANQEQEDLLFSIYKKESFNSDISFLIQGLPSVHNMLFTQSFAKFRKNCGQACLPVGNPKSQCKYCGTAFTLASKSGQLLRKFDTNRQENLKKEDTNGFDFDSDSVASDPSDTSENLEDSSSS